MYSVLNKLSETIYFYISKNISSYTFVAFLKSPKAFSVLTVCSFHVTYAFQSESTLYSCLNFKELLARNRREIWSLSDCNWTRTHNPLVLKRTPNHLVKLAKWLSVRLWTKGLWVESSCSHLNLQCILTDTHRENVTSNKTPALTKSMNIEHQINSLYEVVSSTVSSTKSLVLCSFFPRTYTQLALKWKRKVKAFSRVKTKTLSVSLRLRKLEKIRKIWKLLEVEPSPQSPCQE